MYHSGPQYIKLQFMEVSPVDGTRTEELCEYIVAVGYQSSHSPSTKILSASEMRRLLLRFKLAHPTDLVGRIFEAPEQKNPKTGLEWILNLPVSQ